MSKEIFAQVLRDARLRAGLTQSQLAKRMAVTQSYVSKYEAAEQRLDIVEIEAVCVAAGTDLLTLMEKYLEAKSSLPQSASGVLGPRKDD